MKSAIGAFTASGNMSLERGDGFVFGCLKEDERGIHGARGLVVDVVKNKELVELARPFPAVFHRAFVRSHPTSLSRALLF